MGLPHLPGAPEKLAFLILKSPHLSIRISNWRQVGGMLLMLPGQSEREAEMTPITLKNGGGVAEDRHSPLFVGRSPERSGSGGVMGTLPFPFPHSSAECHSHGLLPLVSVPQSSLGTLGGGVAAGFAWLSPARWSLQESPHGRGTLSPLLPRPAAQRVAAGLQFPLWFTRTLPGPADVIFTFLTATLQPSPPSLDLHSILCTVSPSGSLAPPQPAHQAPARLLCLSGCAASKAVLDAQCSSGCMAGRPLSLPP